ncbi:MAG: hypothetical protein VXZ82_24145 [Planctomycetota bacterium]|nr:hypothetical protein [Planctomycetota bacterium]
MAKFYVQSGNVKTVIAADDSEKAALWVVHKALQQVIPVYEDAGLTPDEKSEVTIVQGVMVLGNDIRINEVGFDRHDGETLDTFEILVQWHQLMIALERLQAHLDIQEESLEEKSVSVESMRRF